MDHSGKTTKPDTRIVCTYLPNEDTEEQERIEIYTTEVEDTGRGHNSNAPHQPLSPTTTTVEMENPLQWGFAPTVDLPGPGKEKTLHLMSNLSGYFFVQRPDQDGETVEESSVEPKIEMFACSECEFTSSSEKSLSQHLKRHNILKKFHCHECGYKTKCKYQLQCHQLTHTDKRRFKCSVGACTYITNHKKNLMQHHLMHSGIKLFKCNECEFSTNHAPNLKQHELVHTGVRNHKCSECSFMFKRKSHLIQHMRVHEETKKYKCFSCEYETNWEKCLRQHLEKHHVKGGQPDETVQEQDVTVPDPVEESNPREETPPPPSPPPSPPPAPASVKKKRSTTKRGNKSPGAKTFKCTECNFTTNHGPNLKQHSLVHSGIRNFKCPKCSYMCKRKSHLSQHLLNHEKRKKFRCCYCDYMTNWDKCLKKHLEKKHASKVVLTEKNHTAKVVLTPNTPSKITNKQKKASNTQVVKIIVK